MAKMPLSVSEVTFTIPGTRGLCFRAALLFASVNSIQLLAIDLMAGVGDCFGNFDAVLAACLTTLAIFNYIVAMAFISSLFSNWSRRLAYLVLLNAILFTLGWEATTATICSGVLAVLQCALAIDFLWRIQRKDVIQNVVAFAAVGTFLVILPLPPAITFIADVPVFCYSYTLLFACFILLQLLAYLRFFIFQLPTILVTAQILGLPQQQDGSVVQLLSLFLFAN